MHSPICASSRNTCLIFIFFQEVDGWYFLLSEELGRHKHLKVAPADIHVTNKNQSEGSKHPESNNAQSERSKQLTVLSPSDHYHHHVHNAVMLSSQNLPQPSLIGSHQDLDAVPPKVVNIITWSR